MMKTRTKRILATVSLVAFAVTALVGCGGSKAPTKADAPKDPIRIACKPMAEQMILQEILAQIIEAKTDYTVERIEPIAGGTANIQIAMENKEVDLYPEYTGTGWLTVLKQPATDNADEMFAQLKDQYKEKFDWSWVGMYGFENTYTLAVRAETAEQYNLKAISNLAAVAPELVFGANFDYFEREDGYQKVCDTYSLNFKGTAEVDMGLKYQTLVEKNCDVINAYTTDSQIAEFGLVTLQDDKHLFTDYRCCTVVRNEILAAYPELEDALMVMENLISNAEMTQMNYELNSLHRLESEIAADFLKAKGIVK